MRQPKPKRRTRGIAKFRKSEIARAARGMMDAGFPVRGIEVDPATGTLRVLVDKPGEAGAGNSWDDLLKGKATQILE
jgi:hypothetical protein